MSAALHFPPSSRDFQVYQRVVLEAATTRQAAGDFSLSQTRIRQIVQRVSEWLAEALPEKTDAADAAYLHLAQHVAADRLQYIYSQAMHGWRATNESKYAGVVLRVIAATSKLPVISGTLEALAADAIEGPDSVVLSRREGPEAEQSVHSAATSLVAAASSPLPGPDGGMGLHSPPPRDCSTSAKNLQSEAAIQLPQPIITPAPARVSNDDHSNVFAARRAFLAPAQPSLSTDDPPLTQLKIMPTQLGLSIEKKLSRRQRRKLRRVRHAK